MGSASALEPVTDAVLARVRLVLTGRLFEVSQSSPTTKREVAVYDTVAPAQAVKPYVVVGDAPGTSPYNTLGPASGPKWGAIATVPVRVFAVYPTSRNQVLRIWTVARAGLEDERLTVAGFGRALAECTLEQLLTDTIQGVVVLELVGQIELTVHQGSS